MELTRGAIAVLTTILQREGWYEGRVDFIYQAGMLLTEILQPALENPPQASQQADGKVGVTAAEVNKWLSEVVELRSGIDGLWPNRTEEAIVACVRYSIKQSFLGVTPYLMEILKKFNISE